MQPFGGNRRSIPNRIDEKKISSSSCLAGLRQMISTLTVSVVIATKNRRDDLRRAIASCLRQSASPEIVVIDDGSTDDTSEMVAREFPTVRLYRDRLSRSVVVQRNRGARLASGEIVVSIDDDAEFPSPHTIAQTLQEFGDPSVGAIAIPFINVTQGPEVLQRAPRRGGKFLTANFWGTAYAVRRQVFLELGGYREVLGQEMEEEDFCIRMLDAGYFTVLGNADPIHHFFSPSRDNRWRNIRGARNRVLFCWYNVPMPDLLLHLPGICANRIAYGIRSGYVLEALRGIGEGLLDWLRHPGERMPVSSAACREFRSLRRLAGQPLETGRRRLALGAPSRHPAPRGSAVPT